MSFVQHYRCRFSGWPVSRIKDKQQGSDASAAGKQEDQDQDPNYRKDSINNRFYGSDRMKDGIDDSPEYLTGSPDQDQDQKK